eukprot:1968046-Pyramimonas_sp.AAC.1
MAPIKQCGTALQDYARTPNAHTGQAILDAPPTQVGTDGAETLKYKPPITDKRRDLSGAVA